MSEIRKVMMWRGTHPDEDIASNIVQFIAKCNIPGVSTDQVLSGNERVPVGGINMMRAYTIGAQLARGEINPADLTPATIEQVRRAQEVTAINQKYWASLDMHNSLGRCEDYASIGVGRKIDPRLLGFFRHVLGLDTILVADFGMRNYSDNCALIEIDRQSERADPQYWPSKVRQLTSGNLQEAQASDFRWWRWACDISKKKAAEYGILDQHFEPYDPLPEQTWELAGGQALYASICDNPNPDTQWWAEAVVPIDAPDLKLGSVIKVL